MPREHNAWAFPAEWTVEQGRDAYLAQNGFSLAAYEETVSHFKYAGVPVVVPNTATRRWAIRLHDLHHVATGFGTDPIGEAEISAWELRSGLRSLGPYVGAIVLSAAVAGCVFAPARTRAAWNAAAHARSLFSLPNALPNLDYAQLLTLRIGALRTLLGVPERGLATHPSGMHRHRARSHN